jgi:hypothetical protein
LSARCGCHEWIRKVLCFPRNLVAPELHDAHGVGRLAVIGQDEFSDPKIADASDSSDSKPLFARLTSLVAKPESIVALQFEPLPPIAVVNDRGFVTANLDSFMGHGVPVCVIEEFAVAENLFSWRSK